jgi:FtsP/CotA-like multicopper oxidase with cupredoxin domain
MITLESPTRTERRTFANTRVYSAALLTLGAGLIHLAVAPAHLREYVPFGLFLVAVGSAQIVLAVDFALRPTRRLALVLTVGTVLIVSLWFASRTVGLPMGSTPGQVETVGLTDVICQVMEVISIMLFVGLVAWPARRRVRRLWLVAIGLLPPALLSLLMTTVAVAAALNGMPEAVNAAPMIAGQPTTSITSLVAAPGDQPVKRFVLTAAVSQIEGQQVFALNGSVPGPELRVNLGDRVEVTLINHLPEATTLHWHGVMVPNAEDGVAGVTQDAVQPGATYHYEFIANEAGSFWYHSHQQTGEQLPLGMFGPLVVLPAGGIAQQRDYTLMLHGTSGDVSIDGAADTLPLDALPGETVRLRIINAVDPAMDGGPEAPALVGVPYQVVSLDGRDLVAPDVLGPARIPLGMGQRADVVFTMPVSGSVRLVDTEITGEVGAVQKFFFGDAQPKLASVTVGTGDAPSIDASALPLFDALHYGAPAGDMVVSATPDQSVPVVLGENPGIRDGRPQLVHTINGNASPNVPPIVVSEGQVVRLHIVNTTGEYHPMHLHGHVMSVIAIDGQALEGSPVHLDSVLVGPQQTMDVDFAANNPGVWMFHCHVLLHADMGMTTSINYVGYATPFEMGTRSGNMPE